MDHILNRELPVLIPNWKGNPFDGTQFHYTGKAFTPAFSQLLKWQFSANPQRAEKKADTWRPEVRPLDLRSLDKSGNWLVWLGHATFLIQLNGLRFVTDPVLYNVSILKRLSPLPLAPELLSDIDYILLSHDHRDHCDVKSLRLLTQNNRTTILTSLLMGKLIRPWIGQTPVQEAAWFQAFSIPHKQLEIIYLPSQHWCRRGLTDFNRRLWGSFLLRSPDATIYFGADSATGDHFAEIGHHFEGIDLAILGIGAYKPDYMMSEVHTNPEETAAAFQQLQARKMLPMHHGTFDLSDEPVSEPQRRLHAVFENGRRHQLIAPAIGEVVRL